MTLSEKKYRRQVIGCWQGKAIGGTLGMPFEGLPGERDLTFYEPVPTESEPNDDLELQVLWGMTLAAQPAPVVDRELLADAWLRHNRYPCDEYGIATRNLEWGLRPPFSGRCGNYFINGMGAAIRSEIWACLAPGNPELAAKFAGEDGCIDHEGDGLYAEIFLAALESAAFVDRDLRRLLDIGLSYIPADCRLAAAIRDTIRWCGETGERRAVRRRIIERYGNGNFTDVLTNIPFIILGLLLGKGDFGRTVCEAVNCGRDTDCTGATAGAIFGIMNPDGIPPRWSKPIGDELRLSRWIVGLEAPATITAFADLVCDLRARVTLRPDRPENPPDLSPARVRLEKLVLPPADCRREIPESAAWTPFDTIGWSGRIPAAELDGGKTLLLRGRFRLRERDTVRVIFNTDAGSRVSIDGIFRFGRDERGHLLPATHRTALNQYCDLELAAGEHEILARLTATDDYQPELRFHFGVARSKDMLWIADAFRS